MRWITPGIGHFWATGSAVTESPGCGSLRNRFSDSGKKLRVLLRKGRGRSLKQTIQDISLLIRGWTAYFRLAETPSIFRALDGWIRRKLRGILWRQWKRRRTKAMALIRRGVDKGRAWRAAYNRHGPWWNAGAAHMERA